MARTFRHTDDDDDENFETTPSGTRILRDGGRARVSLMDAVNAREHQRPHLHDGRGNPVGHRPGFVVSDAIVRDEVARAYSSYDASITMAWQNPTGVGENDEPDDLHRSIDDHAVTMDQVYQQYDAALREAWRTPPTGADAAPRRRS